MTRIHTCFTSFIDRKVDRKIQRKKEIKEERQKERKKGIYINMYYVCIIMYIYIYR